MDQRITSAGLLTPASNTPAQSVGSGTPNASPPNIPLTPATTASLDNNLSTNVSASSSIPDPEGLGVLNPNDESNNEQSTGFLPIQSCYCVVCLKCFFCGKPYHKFLNTHCLCKDTSIPCLPQVKPEDTELMGTNSYKRAYTIDWIKRNADDNVYNLNTGFQIDEGELNSIPLCDEHYEAYVQEWMQYFHGHENVLEGLGIFPDPETEQQILNGFEEPLEEPTYYIYRFYNWIEDRPRDVRSLVNFPERANEEHILHRDSDDPSSFGELFDEYFALLHINNSERINLVYHDPITNETYPSWKDMKEVFTADGIMHRTFYVGLHVAYKDLFD